LLNYPVSQYVAPAGIYHMAQHLDEWEGTDYDGTSVRAGAKVLHHLGFIGGYQWATNFSSMVNALLEQGPCVIGVNWYEGMWQPDGGGTIYATGVLEGGHALLANGVDTVRQRIRVKNNWGRAWGRRGRAWVSFADMAKLLREDGEVCLAVEQRPTVAAVPVPARPTRRRV